jgi:cysteine sulfinate desulfinase/cysteine desulfurase-like protein
MKLQSAAARQMIRQSLGIETTDTEVDTAVAAVVGTVGRLRRQSTDELAFSRVRAKGVAPNTRADA